MCATGQCGGLLPKLPGMKDFISHPLTSLYSVIFYGVLFCFLGVNFVGHTLIKVRDFFV